VDSKEAEFQATCKQRWHTEETYKVGLNLLDGVYEELAKDPKSAELTEEEVEYTMRGVWVLAAEFKRMLEEGSGTTPVAIQMISGFIGIAAGMAQNDIQRMILALQLKHTGEGLVALSQMNTLIKQALGRDMNDIFKDSPTTGRSLRDKNN
jgi:hypothetical protein